MCTSHSAPSYTPPKVDPAPTTVQASDVETTTAAQTQRRKRGRSSTQLANDRGTILGSLGDGTRTTLG